MSGSSAKPPRPARAQSRPSLDEVRAELAERSLSAFIRLGWRWIDPSEFISNWHIDAICEHLEAVTRGRSRRLLINMPPRHMKSLGVSVAWPAWTWAQASPGPLSGPHTAFLFAAYAQSLSLRDSLKCRRLIESPWYQAQWGGRFHLASDQNTKVRFDNDRQGFRLATSVDGALTGEGGSIVVVDDPHNIGEAESALVREATLDWWAEAMSTRLNDPRTGAYVVVMQRVHERDLSGHILAREMGWDHLCLPARYEPDHPFVYAKDPRTRPGELLWPARLGEAEVAALETAMGAYAAAGQLQQRPAPRDGGLFQRRWFETVGAAPASCVRVRKWDLAATAASGRGDPDWTVGVRMARDGDGFFYVEDAVRIRASAHAVERLIKATAAADGAEVMIGFPQDPGQAGKAQAGYLTRALAGFNVVAGPETGSKQVRAAPFAAQAEAGNVRLVRGAWNEAFLAELEMFPGGAHDDQVDAAAGAFAMLAQPGVKGWAVLELARRELAETKGGADPEPAETAYAPGSLEWQGAQTRKDEDSV